MTTAPTLTELFQSISSDFKSRFSINSENDLKRTLTALAASNAGLLKLVYLAILDVQKNIWPDTADSENNGGTLERFGRVKLSRDPYPATQGEYTLSITGTVGGNIPVGTQFKSSTNNTVLAAIYTTTESLTLTSTSGTIKVISDKFGTDYALSVGDILNPVNPILNIDSNATVTVINTIAEDSEDIEIYRELVLQAFRLEPNGGSASDYVYWALDVEGIRAVYPYTTFGSSGLATIYAEATVSASTDNHGTPSQTLLDSLWKKSDRTGVFELDPDTTQTIYNRGRRQLGLSEITILPVTTFPVIVTIQNLKNQTDAIKNSIESEIIKTLYYKRPYVAGVGDINDRNDTLYLSDIIASIQNAVETGNTFDNVSITVNGLGIPFQFLEGNIPYLDSIVYAD